MNIYECSEADLATIPKIGTKTAKAIKDLVQEVKKGNTCPFDSQRLGGCQILCGVLDRAPL